MKKKTFLCVYDYDMGGIWMLIEARTPEEIEKQYPELKAFEDKPDWMSDAQKQEFAEICDRVGFHWDIDKQPTGLLCNIKRIS